MAHEQLWFDDNPNDNAGFFPEMAQNQARQCTGKLKISVQIRVAREINGPNYDDNRMKAGCG
ncbi:MAG: hypothetical protein Q7U66_11410 [Methylobacter sp.]|nr:hypothetical protein [Methylobacter sp.]